MPVSRSWLVVPVVGLVFAAVVAGVVFPDATAGGGRPPVERGPDAGQNETTVGTASGPISIVVPLVIAVVLAAAGWVVKRRRRPPGR